MPRLFSVPAFRFSIVDPQSAIGKWSRIATFGMKAKDGAEMVFDATTLGEMVDNAAARGDRIAICADHLSAYVAQTGQAAPALGFFDALALVEGGQVVRSWADDPPDATALDDGLYARLAEITPRGADPLVGLANYRSLSPMFTERGTDEGGTSIGFALYDVAATNTPFQAGTEITFHATGAARALGANMDDLFSKYLGMGEDADPAAVRAAFKSFLNKYDKLMNEKEAAAAAEKMASDHEEPDGDEPKEDEKKMSDDEEDKKEMAALARSFGLDPSTPRRVLFAAIRSSAVPTSRIEEIRAEAKAAARAEIEAEAKAAEARRVGEAYAERAQRLGMRLDGEGERAAFVAFAAANPTAAEKVIAAMPGARVLGRITRGGDPVGAQRVEVPAGETTANNVRVLGRSLSAAAKQLLAEGKAKDIGEAQVLAIRANPALAAE